MRTYLHEILTLLGPNKKQIPRLLLLFLLVSMFDLLGIGLIGPYVAIVVDPQLAENTISNVNIWFNFSVQPESLLTIMSFVLIGVFLVKAIAAVWINYIIIRFSANQKIRLRTLLMHSFQSLPYTTYISRNSSEYVHSLQVLVEDYTDGVVTVGMRLLSDGIVAVAILALLAWTNPLALLLLVALFGSVILGYDLFFRKEIQYCGQQANIVSTLIVKGVHEGIEGLKEVRILGCENFFLQEIIDNSKKYGSFYTRSTILSTVPRYLLELVMAFFIVLLVLLTLKFQNNFQQFLPTLSMFGLAAIRLMPASNVLANGLARLRYNRNSVSRLYQDVSKIQDLNISIKTKPTSLHVPFESLSMHKVSFRYPGAKTDSLDNITLNIHPGESIGIIGASGSGKTTLVDTLLGLLEPQHGKIEFNGRPLNESLESWRNHVAYLPQEVFLIDNSLKRNVALGIADKDINEDQLKYSLQKSRLTELVNQLPQGIETKLGERGVKLSGGQRQRIALARAFYHERDVLVMDEATSSLDTETEQEIVEEIKYLKGYKTMIVIAHRLTTLKNCDYIYELKKGKLLSISKYEDIISTKNI